MVKVREDHPLDAEGRIDIQVWCDRLDTLNNTLNDKEKSALVRAALLTQNVQENVPAASVSIVDIDCLSWGLEMVEILADLHLDHETLIAAVLYRAVREQRLSVDDLESQFGAAVAKLIRGVQGMAIITNMRNDSPESVFGRESAEQTENVRKMLVSMVDDVRVALIKLAERTCAIRAVKNAPNDKRQRVAKEVSDIYAPLAHRLGIGHIKWELEDLAFRYLQADEYKQIARLLDEKRLDRQHFIDEVINTLNTELAKANIDGSVMGRAKHIYSIWRKMQRKDIGFSQVYDIRAVRILVPTVRDCYSVLGIAHSLWRNIPNEFDDYIASPKENGYRSLHTAVIGPQQKVLEVQIRTKSMHEEAEFGVCAHWRYKGTDSEGVQDSYEQKIEWLRQVLEWHDEIGGGDPLQDDLVTGVEQDRIYVFTPEGHIIDLPQSATPLDFAYRIHTDVGHCCRGAKVNGRIVPLNHPLKTSDQVEILTGKREAPSRDWLAPGLGYLMTSRARAKVQHWFKMQARDKNIEDGRALMDREFKRLGLLDLDFDGLANSMNLKSLDDLYAAVGASDLGVHQVLNAAQRLLDFNDVKDPVVPLSKSKVKADGANDIFIEGVGNMLTHIAGCCNPVPGDAIVGYITLGRGVSVHRQDCTNILQLGEDEPERIIKVDWGSAPQQMYSVDVIIEAFDRYGLLKDITTLLDTHRINVSAMQTLSDKGKNTVDMVFTVEIRSFEELSRVLAIMNQLPNVASARRRR
ncbi:GTP diphosphokinase [Marinibactrum halimedae]|uniref:GTP pyrophosphokinase n=1 Tax=Marinibactrum halimedae TaxID=1444977 RepID=A0AA37WPQ6_9GAMM|nr:GTP diphosphokinase [Marinibactrum halimedae]MCD9459190.1 GTP diphosphokinase [Marinibactrum halimedae]GLS27261.1 GTP pyrophosphokinase [Marinibactrum halimedae]